MKYRKRPVVIEAVQFKGSTSDVADIKDWMSTGVYQESKGKLRDIRSMEIETLEGTMQAMPYDWIIKGIQDEFYPCKPDIFEATYEPAKSNAIHIRETDDWIAVYQGDQYVWGTHSCSIRDGLEALGIPYTYEWRDLDEDGIGMDDFFVERLDGQG